MPKLMPTRQKVDQRIFAILECLKNCGGYFDGLQEFINYLILNLPPEYIESNSTNKTHSLLEFIKRRMIGSGLLKKENINCITSKKVRILIGDRDFSPVSAPVPAQQHTKTLAAEENHDGEIDFDHLLAKIQLRKATIADMEMVLAVIKEIKPYVVELEHKIRSERAEIARLEEKTEKLSETLGEAIYQRNGWKQRYDKLYQEKISSIGKDAELARVRVAGVIATPGG